MKKWNFGMENGKKKRIKISYTPELIAYIAATGFNDKFGARPLRRAITKNIEDTIALKYIKGELNEDTKYTLDVQNAQVIVTE